MDISELHTKFNAIISKYGLSSPDKAQELTNYIISKQEHSAQELAQLFNIELEEAHIILQFLQKGIDYKNSTSSL